MDVCGFMDGSIIRDFLQSTWKEGSSGKAIRLRCAPRAEMVSPACLTLWLLPGQSQKEDIQEPWSCVTQLGWLSPLWLHNSRFSPRPLVERCVDKREGQSYTLLSSPTAWGLPCRCLWRIKKEAFHSESEAVGAVSSKVVLGFSKRETTEFVGFSMFLNTAALETAPSCLSWIHWPCSATVGTGGSYLFCYLGFPTFPLKDYRNWSYPIMLALGTSVGFSFSLSYLFGITLNALQEQTGYVLSPWLYDRWLTVIR